MWSGRAWFFLGGAKFQDTAVGSGKARYGRVRYGVVRYGMVRWGAVG